MNIVFITEASMLDPSAAAFVRMLELSKAMTLNSDNKVYITSLLQENQTLKAQKMYGDFEIYATGIYKNDPRNFFIRRYFSFSKKQKELTEICRFFKKSNEQTVFVVYNFLGTFYDEFCTIKKIKRFGFQVLVEKNELSLGIALNLASPGGKKSFPFIFLKLINIINGFLSDELVRFYDGGFVISSFFEKFTSKRSTATFVKIPILYHAMSPPKEKSCENQQNGILKLGYFGTITLKRDRVLQILKAILILRNKYQFHRIKFTITGVGNRYAINAIKDYITNNHLESIVDYLGFIDNALLHDVQYSQDILIVLRNKSLQGQASFATKLANYMHLGKLVLANDVSDNKKYIQNGENGFLIKDTDPETIARTIIDISDITNDKKERIKKKAKDTALQYFHYKNYSNEVQLFLRKIVLLS